MTESGITELVIPEPEVSGSAMIKSNTNGFVPLVLKERAFAFTSGVSFREFAERSMDPALLRNRYREVRLPVREQDYFINYPEHLHLIALVGEETPETAIVLPILARIGEGSPRFTFHVICETDNRTLLAGLVDEIDLSGDLSQLDLPLLLAFDEEWLFQGQWGPHPQAAESHLDVWFESNPEYAALAEDETLAAQDKFAELLTRLTHEMRVWYNSGLQAECVREVQQFLADLLGESGSEQNSAQNGAASFSKKSPTAAQKDAAQKDAAPEDTEQEESEDKGEGAV
jgi:hypothetical protein